MEEDWKPKLKHYPHFDAPLNIDEILDIVQNPERVAQNAFYPFLLYIDVQGKFGRGPAKKRPIRYACRRDAYIFAYYRHLLSQEYEQKLTEHGIDDAVIAYRKIPVIPGKRGGKCNIDFARDVFEEIKRRGDCYAVALDISSYFENIDHEKLKTLWCGLMGFEELPPDHEAVFKNITDYREVDFDKVCTILGYKGKVTIDGVDKVGFKRDVPKNKFFREAEYKQLCTPEEFRKKIVPAKIIQKNEHPYGIPQGSPISDLLANLFLINFDRKIKEYAAQNDIYYCRYSDDILLILPKNEGVLNAAIEAVKREISNAGPELSIKDRKTHIKVFQQGKGRIHCKPFVIQGLEAQHMGDGFEYLGFAFDGKSVRIKDSTMHRFHRKMRWGARREAAKTVKRYSDKTVKEISNKINFGKLYEKYGNIEDFQDLDFSTLADKKRLTFIAYAKRAERIMSDFDTKIGQQIEGHKQSLRKILDEEIIEQWKTHKAKLNDAA